MRRKGVLSGVKKSKRYKLLQAGLRFLSFILGSKGAEQYKKTPQTSESLSIHSKCLRVSLVYSVLFS